jgi:chemotaxis methyl-accepting protein methylase
MAPITNEEILVMGVVLGICLKKKRRRPRRMWCKKCLTERESYSHVLLLKEVEASAPDDFFN